MHRIVVVLVTAGLLLSVGSAALADRVKDGEPIGEGEKLNFYNVEYINQDEPCWLRIGEYHAVYPGAIPDLKQEYGINNLVEGASDIDIYIDEIQLRRGIQRSVVWRSDISMPEGDWMPAEYDTKFTWYFVQFPAGYFTPGVHEILIVASFHNPNAFLNVVHGGTVYIDIVLHVSD